jgi:hypothetical protein
MIQIESFVDSLPCFPSSSRKNVFQPQTKHKNQLRVKVS